MLAMCAWPALPFTAWLVVGECYVRTHADAASPAVGLLTYGDIVSVMGCDPTCDTPGAWAVLDPFGAVRLSFLSPTPPTELARAQSAIAQFLHGTVRGGGATVYVEPDTHSLVAARLRPGQSLAFRDDLVLLSEGWLRRPNGGYVQAERIRVATPSLFAGEHYPGAPLAFLRQQVTTGDRTLERYDRVAVLSFADDSVETSVGPLPRAAVHLARRHPRPTVVATHDKWVHVDLDEQVLTAYEGDTLVFATLISSGKPSKPTRAGLFRVYQKAIHFDMRGRDQADPYHVEEVPYVQYFDGDIALHGAYWHDSFGTKVSHGCVNLSLLDAAWLFDWSPPALPASWHAVMPDKDSPTLWVRVEGGPSELSWIDAATLASVAK